MLNLLEKLQYGLSAVVTLGAVALYLWQPPEHRSVQTLAAPTRVPPSPPVRPQSPVPPPEPQKRQVSPEDQAILKRLQSEQNVREIAGKELQREAYEVEPDTFDYLKREANWTPELNKAKSETLPGADGQLTRLRVFDIDEDSLLKFYKFQDGDIVEFLDGERVDFNAGSVEHIQRWKAIKEKIEKGQKLSVTITRGDQPMQLEFKLKGLSRASK